jgi:hypothetical protein
MTRTGTATQLRNVAAFSSKLLGLGVCRDALGPVALSYLQDALENDEEVTDTARLLPAAVVWIEHSRTQLLAFSIKHGFDHNR